MEPRLSRSAFPARPLALAVITAFAGQALAQQPTSEQTLDAITVSAENLSPTTEGRASYAASSSNTAAGFALTPRETPQAMSVMTRSQMNDFGLTNANDALKAVPGINVEQVETDRTYYTARGFDITNFQVDGLGLPQMYGNVSGNVDTVIYDRIEVLRGGTGLMAGMSDPSATINFIRKRPTAKLQASASAMFGSWNNRRLEADVSRKLNDSGTVRGRLVAAYQNRDSYLDRYSLEKSVLYGVLEADLAPATVLTLGHHLQDNNADSPLWGALPLYDTDGTPTRYARSISTATDWAYWDGRKTGSFAELAHDFGGGWQGKAVLTRYKTTENSRLFYVYGTPNPTTPGSDLFSYPSLYNMKSTQTLLDLHANGPFTLFGRKHELVAGLNWARARLNDVSYYGEDIGTEIPPLETWDGSYPMPGFTGGTNGSRFADYQRSAYAAARLNLNDRLTAITGLRWIDLESSGTSYGLSRNRSYGSKVTPYAGASYRLNDNYSLYASHTRLFRPQTEVGADLQRLEPVNGHSTEAGIKGEFLNKKLNAALALFKTRQRNLAQPAGLVGATAIHTAADRVDSAGYELDLSGEVATGLQVNGGYTWVKIEDANGAPTRRHVPRRVLKLAASYRVPAMPALKVGGSVHWQDDVEIVHATNATTGPNAGSPIVTRQKAYALLNLMAQYELTKNLNLTLNLNNVTDERHYESLYWASFGQGYYGAPRNASLTLSWNY